MAGSVRVICDMYVAFFALIMVACVFHGAQCDDNRLNSGRAQPRRGVMPHKAEPVDGFQQPNYQTNKVVHENEADNDNVKRSASRVLKLSEDPACAADVSRICGKITGQNNFAVIDCLQNDLMKDEEISEACQHLVWSYKHNLTMDFRFDTAALEICRTTLDQIVECSGLPDGRGLKIPCLIENIDNVTNSNCKAFLRRMESIVFSDYRLIYKFADKCKSDIDALKCGRLPSNDEDSSSLHNQGQTLTCLAENLDKVKDDCKQELLRVAELQADDYHKDRQLYYACREDRENFCHKVKAGEGRIYKCLFRHKFDPQMSDGCLKMLTLRQQLQQEDYKVNMKLARSCQKDILINRCLPQIEAVAGFKNARLSAILLCLEGAMKDGNEVNPDCVVELKEVRRSLMEDYQISPVLVRECSKEIQDNCGGGLHRDGKTIHCLMDLARPKKNQESRWEVQISDNCVRALEDLLEEADVGDNYEVDPAIQEECEPVVKVLCKDIRPGEGRIMNCLVESLDKPHMTELCKERLMEIYFFITRDFRLDSRLYKLCRQDAKKICQAPDAWYLPSSGTGNAYRPQMKNLVFACLYRHIVQVSSDPSYKSVSRTCSFEVRRVMRERALSVDLDPQIADACLSDLGEHCSDKTLKSEEMECLEDNLESLRNAECKKLISEYAEAADVAPELNDIFQLSCAPFWDKYCPQAIQNDFKKRKEEHGEEANDDDDENDSDDDDEKSDEIGENLMACLVRYKYHPSMDEKCRAGIEHHQLITAKNFTFSHQFSEACKDDVDVRCPLAKENTKKSYVVQCLSEYVRNDTFSDAKKHRISKPCRKQLKIELLQRSSSIKLDPDLESACKLDVEQKCPNVSPGRGAVIQCLRRNQKDLSENCHKMIFKREQEEAQLPMTDYLLMSKCKSMIKRYCVEEMSSPETIFECLQRNKEETNFDKGCFDAIIAREELKAKDIRLNPILEKKCLSDAEKFCSAELKNRVTDKEDDGHVLLCLRKAFAKKRLSETCEEHIREVIIESAKDYLQDLELVKACSDEIKLNCIEFVSDSKKIDNGKVEDCLKERVEKNKMPHSKCYNEVVRIIEESQADIHADIRLFKACSVDLKQHCGEIIRGEGRQMNCLVAIFNDKKIPLDEKCNKTLSQRMQLWNKVSSGGDADLSFQQMANNIVASPSRNYYVGVILVCIGIIFIGGLFCGRVTKRIRREIKDR